MGAGRTRMVGSRLVHGFCVGEPANAEIYDRYTHEFDNDKQKIRWN
jgi:hypothetical protein